MIGPRVNSILIGQEHLITERASFRLIEVESIEKRAHDEKWRQAVRPLCEGWKFCDFGRTRFHDNFKNVEN